jgi:hypothetical protein
MVIPKYRAYEKETSWCARPRYLGDIGSIEIGMALPLSDESAQWSGETVVVALPSCMATNLEAHGPAEKGPAENSAFQFDQ